MYIKKIYCIFSITIYITTSYFELFKFQIPQGTISMLFSKLKQFFVKKTESKVLITVTIDYFLASTTTQIFCLTPISSIQQKNKQVSFFFCIRRDLGIHTLLLFVLMDRPYMLLKQDQTRFGNSSWYHLRRRSNPQKEAIRIRIFKKEETRSNTLYYSINIQK